MILNHDKSFHETPASAASTGSAPVTDCSTAVSLTETFSKSSDTFFNYRDRRDRQSFFHSLMTKIKNFA